MRYEIRLTLNGVWVTIAQTDQLDFAQTAVQAYRQKNPVFRVSLHDTWTGLPVNPESGSDVPPKVHTHLLKGEKIQAIKEAREVFGYGLGDAKRYVDDLEVRFPAYRAAREGYLANQF